MTRRLTIILLPLLLLLAGCGGSEGGPSPTATSAPAGSAPPPVPTQAPQPTATPVNTHPRGIRTQVSAIDEALAALESGDPARLMEQLSFHAYACNDAPSGTAGANPCPPGLAIGTPVDVIAMGGCEVAFVARERADLATQVAGYMREASGQGVYAVSEVQEGRVSSPLPLRYLIVLSGGYSLLLDDAGITHLNAPCGDTGPGQLYHPADRPILAPL